MVISTKTRRIKFSDDVSFFVNYCIPTFGSFKAVLPPPPPKEPHSSSTNNENVITQVTFLAYSSSLSSKVYLFLEGASFLKVDSGGVVGLSFFWISSVGFAISFSSLCWESDKYHIRLHSGVEIMHMTIVRTVYMSILMGKEDMDG